MIIAADFQSGLFRQVEHATSFTNSTNGRLRPVNRGPVDRGECRGEEGSSSDGSRHTGSQSEVSIDVVPEGEKRAQRFQLVSPGAVLDPKAAAFSRGLPLGSEVQVTWTRDVGGRRVTNLAFIAGPGESGLLSGKVTDKSATWIDIREDQGKIDRYSPHWMIAGYAPPGGLEKEMLAAIAQRNIGDRVQIRWVIIEGNRRVSTMRVLAIATPATGQPATECGTVIGLVVDHGKDWVTIKNENEDPQRYPPNASRASGELDKDVSRRIATISRGELVERGGTKMESGGSTTLNPQLPSGQKPLQRRPCRDLSG